VRFLIIILAIPAGATAASFAAAGASAATRSASRAAVQDAPVCARSLQEVMPPCSRSVLC